MVGYVRLLGSPSNWAFLLLWYIFLSPVCAFETLGQECTLSICYSKTCFVGYLGCRGQIYLKITSLLHFLPSMKSHLGVKTTPTNTYLMLKPEGATSSQTYKIKLQVFPRNTWSAQKSLQAASSQPCPWLQSPDAAGAKAANGSLRGKYGLLSTGRRITDVGVLVFFWHVSPTQSHYLRLE